MSQRWPGPGRNPGRWASPWCDAFSMLLCGHCGRHCGAAQLTHGFVQVHYDPRLRVALGRKRPVLAVAGAWQGWPKRWPCGRCRYGLTLDAALARSVGRKRRIVVPAKEPDLQ